MQNVRVLNVPNTLSCIRLLLVPAMLSLAWLGWSAAFLVCLCFTILTDAFDGWLARILRQTSELGSKLDSWADFLTYFTLPLSAWWLRPDALQSEAPYLAIAFGCYLAAIGFGFLKYGRLTSYHTWGAKLLAVIISVAAILFFAGSPGWCLRIVVPLVLLTQIEEIMITALLPVWRNDVPSFWHAAKLRRTLSRGGRTAH